MSNSQQELEKLYHFAQDATHEAGRLTLGYFQRPLEVENKADASPVTVADKNAELYIRQRIEAAFPDHGIIGEEFEEKEPRNGCSYRWVIDPIDGTKSFISGVPLYSTLLGLLREDDSVVGVLGLPALGEQLAAARGMGAWLNGRPARVSETSELSQAVGLTTDLRHLAEMHDPAKWQPIMDQCRFSRTWGDAYGHFLVATGRADFMLDAELALHDCACLLVILEEAGGAFFDWTGNATVHGGNGISLNMNLKDLIKSKL